MSRLSKSGLSSTVLRGEGAVRGWLCLHPSLPASVERSWGLGPPEVKGHTLAAVSRSELTAGLCWISQGFKQKATFSKAEILHENFWFLLKSQKMW